jgi:hypothetical protein
MEAMQEMYDWLTTWDRHVKSEEKKRPIEDHRDTKRRKVHVKKREEVSNNS